MGLTLNSAYHKIIKSPVGELLLVASDSGLSSLIWDREGFERPGIEDNNHPILLETEQQLNEYFAKKRQTFSLPLDFDGTVFQKKVWEALLTIPFGETRTYGDIAKQIGSPQAVRAVGGAANKNPICIVAPCHRVIGATGKLVGFGGGLMNKTLLLEIERPQAQLSLWG
ncbi:methylated-DNA--[protein]-cysteine S-methyltransferase [Dyadobacter chenwenxiniae]|uniref:Methylated-DNA--protein-cysteine methyltransferase n=1 Tax=Dyadobacter chenwenxiniae TaxID=2906456 RepID=A0A9X1PG18_9BACT|nr:methylated-DNA--[protein]-cysteine S-methyltransferase [Dyadobacter chenwenxiniae]MCF0060512.1 methylated-DNA--[protein]-cysteine S-methyltransferase [Dyadobacter chenwenxiniae]UON86244.1 methylated-DNA--[protein]-cysteine S-methyltransferase [Dyadobacter chenwenxiniae]